MGGTTIHIAPDGSSEVRFGTGGGQANPPIPKEGALAVEDADTVLFVVPMRGDNARMTVEAAGPSLVSLGDAGEATLSEATVVFMQAATRLAAEFAETSKVSIADVEAQIEMRPSGAAHILLSVPSLSSAAHYEPETDVVPPTPPTAKFKYNSATDKFDAMIDAHDVELPGRGKMPARIRKRLKEAVCRLGVKMASKEAPPSDEPSFINDPESVLRLRFKPDADLSHVYSPWRPLAREAFEALQKQAAAWRKAGVFVKVSKGEAQVVSVPIVVPKVDQNGNRTGWRVAIDLRRLNDALLPDRYAPAPRLFIVRRIAERADAVSTLDGASLYTQFRVDPEHQRYFVVQTAPGKYDKMAGAPFGVSTMPGHAQLWMEQNLVAGDDDKDVYADDLHVTHVRGCSWDQIGEQLIELFERCARFNVVLNVDKFQIAQVRSIVLGYLVDCATHTLQPNPAR